MPVYCDNTNTIKGYDTTILVDRVVEDQYIIGTEKYRLEDHSLEVLLQKTRNADCVKQVWENPKQVTTNLNRVSGDFNFFVDQDGNILGQVNFNHWTTQWTSGYNDAFVEKLVSTDFAEPTAKPYAIVCLDYYYDVPKNKGIVVLL